MVRNRLLNLTAVLEIATGIGLLVAPSLLTELLLGSPLDSPLGSAVAHVAGAALLALGTACWLTRKSEESSDQRAVIAGMFVYNIAVVGVFMQARFGMNLFGIALWPVAVIHAFLAIWCIADLR